MALIRKYFVIDIALIFNTSPASNFLLSANYILVATVAAKYLPMLLCLTILWLQLLLALRAICNTAANFAVAVGANCIITGDGKLQALHPLPTCPPYDFGRRAGQAGFQGIPILSPADFLKMF